MIKRAHITGRTEFADAPVRKFEGSTAECWATLWTICKWPETMPELRDQKRNQNKNYPKSGVPIIFGSRSGQLQLIITKLDHLVVSSYLVSTTYPKPKWSLEAVGTQPIFFSGVCWSFQFGNNRTYKLRIVLVIWDPKEERVQSVTSAGRDRADLNIA